MEHAEFPDDETLAAFIDGGVDEETRKEVVAHLANCEECYSTVRAARAWKQSEEPATVVTHPRFGGRRWVAVLAAAAAVAGVVFLTPEARDRYAMHELVAAANARHERPAAELPLSGGFAYRPHMDVKRGGTTDDPETSHVYDPRLDEAAADVAERAENRPTRRNLHALGLAYLLDGHAEDAVSELASAVGGRDGNAINHCNDVDLLIDFGAAAYATGQMPLALAAYTRASSLAPKNLAAKFGRAQTLQILGSRTGDRDRRRHTREAIAAWNEYLKLDPSSGWAVEARDALALLKEPE
jgi:tetratricopeptide (TPR) repeat protein